MQQRLTQRQPQRALQRLQPWPLPRFVFLQRLLVWA
jgi:hypothetical protein